MTSHLALILLAILIGAIVIGTALSSCQAPQVCKHCWVTQ